MEQLKRELAKPLTDEMMRRLENEALRTDLYENCEYTFDDECPKEKRWPRPKRIRATAPQKKVRVE